MSFPTSSNHDRYNHLLHYICNDIATLEMNSIHRGRTSDSLSNKTNERTVTSLIVGFTVATTASVAIFSGLRWYYHSQQRRQQQQLDEESRENNSKHEQTEIQKLQQQRKEERTGRIRAEVRLRTTLKQLQQLQLQLLQYEKAKQHPPLNGRHSTDDESAVQTDSNIDVYNHINSKTKTDRSHSYSHTNSVEEPHRTMLLTCIGTVVTPYTKRMGTPRQGALVPASRGYVQLHHHIPADVATGLELYSHVWVLFEFHANTDLNHTAVDRMTGDYSTKHSNNQHSQNAISKQTKKSKIRPPRGNGIKVGQLATRSPHRPNPMGLSLVTVERWDAPHKRLYISGIDIVNGTPVYDIKPVVPWDVPGYYVNQNTNCNSQNASEDSTSSPILRVPDWVSSTEDVIDNVIFTMTAQEQLQQCIHHGHLAPLYTPDNDGMTGAVTTIQQILAQDPRSSHKGLKSNARGTKVTISPSISTIEIGDNDKNQGDSTSGTTDDQRVSGVTAVPACYSLVFCNVKVSFTVTENDGCRVMEVIPIEFDPNQYVDGVPIITEGLSLE
jgi:tRNA (Thr-GGU) A37 N-methylase